MALQEVAPPRVPGSKVRGLTGTVILPVGEYTRSEIGPGGRVLYRQARLLGMLLLLQVIAMVAFGGWLYARIDWSMIVNLSNQSGEILLHTDDKETLRRFER